MQSMKRVRAVLSVLLAACVLGTLALAGGGCVQNVIGYAVRTFVPYQEVHIPATELGMGLNRGDLVIRLNFKNFGCGGDDVYSNWWVQFENVWARLYDAGPDPIFGNGFEFWCDDMDYFARLAWQGNSFQLDNQTANFSGIGFDIDNIPDEVEQWFFKYAAGLLKQELLDQIEKVVAQYITQERLSNIFVQQAEYSTDTYMSSPYPRGGAIDETIGNSDDPLSGNYYKDVGWLCTAASAYPHMFVMPYSPSVRLGYICDKTIDLGKEYTKFKVSMRVLIKKRPGADPNRVFGSLRVGNLATIDLKPSMFPVDHKWYTFTATYSGAAVRNTNFVFMAHFVDSTGAYYGADLVKVDYVRFAP